MNKKQLSLQNASLFAELERKAKEMEILNIKLEEVNQKTTNLLSEKENLSQKLKLANEENKNLTLKQEELENTISELKNTIIKLTSVPPVFNQTVNSAPLPKTENPHSVLTNDKNLVTETLTPPETTESNLNKISFDSISSIEEFINSPLFNTKVDKVPKETTTPEPAIVAQPEQSYQPTDLAKETEIAVTDNNFEEISTGDETDNAYFEQPIEETSEDAVVEENDEEYLFGGNTNEFDDETNTEEPLPPHIPAYTPPIVNSNKFALAHSEAAQTESKNESLCEYGARIIGKVTRITAETLSKINSVENDEVTERLKTLALGKNESFKLQIMSLAKRNEDSKKIINEMDRLANEAIEYLKNI